MSELIDKRLVDEAVDAYVDWREERASVWDAYARWASAPVADCPLAFSAYGAALDREERAAHVYAELMTRVFVAVPAFQLDVAGERKLEEAKLGVLSAAVLAAAGGCGTLDVSDGNQRVLLHRARSHVRNALERHLDG